MENGTNYQIKLTSFGAGEYDKIHCVRLVRAITGLSLKDSKKLIEHAPVVVCQVSNYATALEIKQQFDYIDAVSDIIGS